MHRERALSLLLGLPLGSTDKTVVSDDLLAQDIPLGRLQCEQARSRDL